MKGQAITYSITIWIGGLLVGNLAVGLFFGIKLIPLAFIFSLMGSALPLVLLVILIFRLVKSQFDYRTRVLILMGFCAFATFAAIAVFLKMINAGRGDWELMLLGIPYTIGLWLGVIWGRKKLLLQDQLDSSMENLLNEIGRK